MVNPFIKDFTALILVENSEIKKHSLDLHTIVRVEISKIKNSEYEARVLEVYDNLDDPRLELEILAQNSGFPTYFSKEALNDAREAAQKKDKKRKDLTQTLSVTIDGEDAKDFDDAICVTKLSEELFNLKVSIADVSFYVEENSALDREAYDRGTSIYFPGQVVPMLPEILSNDACSLVPLKNRYCLTCDMTLDRDGNFKQIEIYPSVIQSRARLTYSQVNEAIFEDSSFKLKAKIQEMLEDAKELYLLLKERRRKLGTLDLDIPERKIEVDKKGDVTSIGLVDRNEAHQLIEQFMVLANEAVSESLEAKQIPSLFRIHEHPTEEKIENFIRVVQTFGFDLERPKEFNTSFFQSFLNQIKKHPEERILRFLLLRSFKQAIYSSENLEHFGLASGSYTHFTSPIRRYPDLVIHRILRSSDFLKKPKSRYDQKSLVKIAEQCSERERRATIASRDMNDLKAARFLENRIGEKFEALIVSIKDFGFFVEIKPYCIDGLVPLRSLPYDDWITNEYETEIFGRRTKMNFRLGQVIEVQLADVSRLKRQVSFRYVEERPRK